MRDTVQLEASSHAIRVGNGRAFLGDMSRQAIYAAFGKVLAAFLACVGIAVAIVVKLGTPDEIFEDERVRFAAHCARQIASTAALRRSVEFQASAARRLAPEPRTEPLMGESQGCRRWRSWWDFEMAVLRGTDSAHVDRQNSHTACEKWLDRLNDIPV